LRFNRVKPKIERRFSMIRKSLSRTKGKRSKGKTSKGKTSRCTGHLERGRKMKKKTSEIPRRKTKKR
jgi:hypothetical protein